MNQFRGKKVLIMGLGLNPKGSGVSAAKFFVSCGAKVVVTDLKDKKDLRKSLRLLRNLPIEFILGKHRESDFKNADLIIKNPGVRRDSPYLQIAKENGIPIETDVGVFWKLCPVPIIGVTGTRGKSTTAALIGEMLTHLPPLNVKGGKGKLKRSVFVGGNIQLSPLNFIEKIKPDSLASAQGLRQDKKVVLELSSWMLEDLFTPLYPSSVPSCGRDRGSKPPHIAVLTNLMPDHLNTYKTFDDYIKAKALIFKNQDEQDFAVLNYDDKRVRKLAKDIRAQKIWFSFSVIPSRKWDGIHKVFIKNKTIYFDKEKIIPISDIQLLGEHNIPNILAAIAVAKLEGVSNKAIQKVLKIFKGLPNRLEFICEARGVKFYNDTTSTIPEATICALRALSQIQNQKSPPTPLYKRGKRGDLFEIRNIILIAGGSDKKLDYKKLAKEIKKYCKAVVLFKGEASNKILKQLLITNYQLPIVENVVSMKDAVSKALGLAGEGDIVLLSPAAASFGLFQNEFDRGEQFVKIVKSL